MQYILSISQAMLDWSQKQNSHSSPIIVAAARDLLLLAEAQLVGQIMTRTANSQQEGTNNIDDLMTSLRDTNRDIQDVLKSIESLQQNIGNNMPVPDQQHEIAQKTASRLAQLRDEAVIIKEYNLAYEIENLLSEIGLL